MTTYKRHISFRLRPSYSKHTSALCFLLCVTLCTFFSAYAYDGYLVTEDMLTSGKVSGLTNAKAATLNPESKKHSAVTIDGGASFTVELSEPITLTDEEGLVVVFGRFEDSGAPTATLVEGSDNGIEYESIGYSYMQYRGPNTIEYSDPLYGRENSKIYKFLRFSVLNTNKGSACFSKFNVFILKKGEPYPDGRIDPLRHSNDYDKTYWNYKFNPTKGILDSRNHYLVHDPNPWSGDLREFYDANGDYPNNTPWSNWEKNTFVYNEKEYTLPTFDMQGGNQMPHVTEHTVYAMPGDVIPLQPFYEMPFNYAYYVRFSHWYGYTPDKYNSDGEAVPQPQTYSHITDNKGNRLLDFLIDPYNIAVSENSGYYAGAYLPLAEKTYVEEEGDALSGKIFVIRNIDDLAAFRNLVENGMSDLNAILADDLDFEGQDPVTIGSYNHPYAGHFNGNGHTIKNMNIATEGNNSVGLFNYVAVGASISNLRLENFNITNGGNTGILIGEIVDGNGIVNIDNLGMTGQINITGLGHGGGLIGQVKGNIVLNVKNISYRGKVTGTGESAALVGNTGDLYNPTSELYFENCYADAYVGKYKKFWLNDKEIIVPIIAICQDYLTISNCIFNIETNSDFNENVKSHINQDGLDCFSTGDVKLGDAIEDNQNVSIFVAKETWTDFVLCYKCNGVYKEIIGYQGSCIYEDEEYVYFETELKKWNSFAYAIIPYNGKEKLDEHNFNWDLPELQFELAYVSDEYKAREKYEYLHIVSKDFTQTLSQNVVFGSQSWKNEDSGYPIPPMKMIRGEEEEELVTNINGQDSDNSESGKSMSIEDFRKYGSHIDLMNWEGFVHRWYGTTATFFQPLDPTKSPEDEANLKLQQSAYHIAADFSHEFSKDHNLEDEESVIYSPIINFRHIFHVLSGKDFADQNTSSGKANQEYLENKRRVVSAIAGKDFQVRLPSEFPVPAEDNAYPATNFYYKVDDSHYELAHGFGIEVTNEDGTAVSDMFSFVDENTVITIGNCIYVDKDKEQWDNKEENYIISLQGTRKYKLSGPTYHTAGGEGLVHRMLECKGENANEGTYNVRIYALDENRNPVMACDGTQKIYMMEYKITFIPDTDASFMINSEYEKSAGDENDSKYNHTDVFLKDACGNPITFLNFDEYKYFEELENQDDYFLYKKVKFEKDKDNNEAWKEVSSFVKFENSNKEKGWKSFKWPTMWSQCSYSFGYGGFMNYDYNEYQIANHSSQVHYWLATTPYIGEDETQIEGLYDRLYYDTLKKYPDKPENVEKGFFYYVNAASDPGVTSRLRLDHLCIGSTVLVTAWVAEFSDNPEKANVAFNFSAVKADGTRVRLHTFITGYIKTPGEWHHVYYSFVPELPEKLLPGEVDHYELELENNCMSSQGADYAIDDIRMYIVSPEIKATQLSPLCDDEQSSTGVRLSTRFDKLLEAEGIPESFGDEGNECALYVAIFDKVLYDKLHADDNVEPHEVLSQSVITQMSADGKNSVKFIRIPMNTNFLKLAKYNLEKPEEFYYTSMGYLSKDIEYLITNIRPWDDNMKPGKQYYISFRLLDGAVDKNHEMTLDQLDVSKDDCAKFGEMTLKGSGIVKVDGFAYNDGEPIEVCIGQSPVLQVDLMKIDKNGNAYLSTEKYYYDWYLGPLENFSSPDEDLDEYLEKFRNLYPDATEIPVAERRVSGFENLTEEEYAALVNEYNVLADAVTRGELVLHQSSYVFPPIKGGDLYLDDQLIITAIPIIGDKLDAGDRVCSQPNEIRLNVSKASPKMYDGFEAITYPDGMTDVPLRVGLRQLKEISTSITKEIPSTFRNLQVPLRAVRSYKDDNSNASMLSHVNQGETDPFVYIVETNDPHYKSLTAHPGQSLVDPSLKLPAPDKETGVVEGLLPVGKITGLTASTGNNGKSVNAVNIVFTKDMQFREGYYYRLRFDFNEIIDGEVAEDACNGQVVFTIKVVPEYQRWTGAAGRNWNNDGNWTRVAKDELFLGSKSEIGEEAVPAADHTTDGGNNDNAMSYAPMDFTKVIIPNDVKNFPLMFGRTQSEVQTLQGSLKWDEKDSDESADHHDATKDIRYDMASNSLTDVLACRPWYVNTCEEIHFRPGSELLRQQYFVFGDNYRKAWVDLETEANRWYTLATPLKQVVAGDMYTISDGAKQNTELFRDITFSNDRYGRFEPAVYQRSWNKAGKAEIHMFGDSSDESHDAAEGISLYWSRVYNQVDENYSGGVGFSINTRYVVDNAENKPTVRFRLPKADDSYSYFTPDDKTEAADDKALGKRDERHSLNTFPLTATLTAKESTKYFLVGNPFMARMDMQKFLDANKGVLSGKYWIMSADRQEAYLWKEGDEKFISTKDGDTGETVAPMQGFFVEANTAATSLELSFTDAMIKETDGEGSAGPLKIGRPGDVSSVLFIDAVVNEETVSRAVIDLDPESGAAYGNAEDAAMLIDQSLEAPAAVYTVASGKALSINSLDRIERTEIGVVASPETRTILRFGGVDESDGLKLLDSATGEVFDLYDGMTFGVEGSSAGRLYIVNSVDGPEAADVAVMLDGRTVSVLAPADGIVARAFDASGVCLGEWTSDGLRLDFDVASGVILIDVTAAGTHTTRKFIVK